MLVACRNGIVSNESPRWLTFTAKEVGSTISMAKYGQIPPAVSLETSINNGKTWVPFTIGTTTITLANIGDKVCFRAGNNGTGGDGINNAFAAYRTSSSGSSFGYNYFVINSGKIAASGDISSILNRNQSVSTLNEYSFAYLFKDCTSLTTAPALPATTLAKECYTSMFSGCTSLTSAPALPATTLANYCYRHMFSGCTSLTTAPTLPATTLASHCYEYMFNGCSNLSKISVGFTAWDANNTNNWVRGVSQVGTFICPSNLSHTSSDFGISKIPTGWTVNTL